MKKIKRILYPVCAVILLFAVWNLWNIKQSTENSTNLYQTLARQARTGQSESKPEPETAEPAEKVVSQETEPETPDDIMAGSFPPENPWLLDLQKQNQELVAWITIPGTVIDYPVMQTAEDDDYYLTHDFEGNEDPHGTPFLDVNCRIGESENMIIYGHHMKDGTMFQNLMRYKEAEFCEANGLIRFDTVEESAQYQVIYVLILSKEETEDFPYYLCIDLSKDETYRRFLQLCGKYAIWSGKELPEPGTRLLTLSTCEYSKENGRLVVIAKQI